MKKSIATTMTIIFSALAIILSNVMSAVVAYQYCDMVYGIEFKGYSAPASTAFALAIPFVLGIVICAIIAIVFHRKSKNAVA